MKIVPRRYTYPPTGEQARSLRYIEWMRAERARIDARRTNGRTMGRQALPGMRTRQDT